MKQRRLQVILLNLTLATILGNQPIRALPEPDRTQDHSAENLTQPQSVADYYRHRRPIPHSLSPSLDVVEAQAIAHAEQIRDRLILDLLTLAPSSATKQG